MASDAGRTEAETELQCGICLSLMWKPVTLVRCGHSFCCLCVMKDMKHRMDNEQVLACPLCRAAVDSKPTVPSVTIENIIQACVARKSDTDRAAEKRRTDEMDHELFLLLGWANTTRSDLWGWFAQGSAVFDPDDQVFRCPACVWEVDRDGVCANQACRRKWTIDHSLLPESPSDESDEDSSNMREWNEESAGSDESDSGSYMSDAE